MSAVAGVRYCAMADCDVVVESSAIYCDVHLDAASETIAQPLHRMPNVSSRDEPLPRNYAVASVCFCATHDCNHVVERSEIYCKAHLDRGVRDQV